MAGSPEHAAAPGATRDDGGAAHAVAAGRSAPLGATVCGGGVNFSVFARRAELIELLLFDDVEAETPARVIPLDAARHRTYHYWHAFVPGLRPGQLYGFRARGPFAPDEGLRFDRTKVLLDPYGRALAVPSRYNRVAASGPGDNAASAMKSVVAESRRLRLGRRRGHSTAVRRDHHLRAARRRLHPAPEFRRRARQARDLRRLDREDSVPPGPRRDRGRTDAGVSVRSAPRAERRELLGLSADLVLCAASRLQFADRSACGARRVPRHGQGVPPRPNRGDPRRRLQSHDGRAVRTARRSVIAAWRTRSTTSSRRTAHAMPTTRAAATR